MKSRRSRISGRNSEGDKARWGRRPGAPSGAKSEATKLGRPAVPSAPGDPSADAMLAAFITRDRDYFRALPEFSGAWMDTPLVDRPGRCTHGHALEATMLGHGCNDQHQAHQLRQHLIAEVERRGGFRWAALADPHEGIAWAAWLKLSGVAEDCGVTGERWREILAASWEPGD